MTAGTRVAAFGALLAALFALAVVAGRLVVAGRTHHAVARVLVHQPEGDLVERGLRGGDLGEDVDAVAVVDHHALDPAYLPLDAAQAREQLILACGVASFGHPISVPLPPRGMLGSAQDHTPCPYHFDQRERCFQLVSTPSTA